VPRKRRLLVLVLAALAGAAVVVLPALAGAEGTPTVEAFNGSGIYSERGWRPASVTIAPGGSITIANPTNVAHGVEWVGAAPSCNGTIPVGKGPGTSGTQWSGTCTFANAGVYVFYCTVHGRSMTGSVTVGTPETAPSAGQAPSTLPQGAATSTSGSTQTGTSTTPVASAPLLSGSALKLAGGPRASSVRGSLNVPAAAAGGKLEVDLLAARAVLARSGGRALTPVGRTVRSSLPAGVVAFKVALSRAALRALHHHKRLALTAKVVLTPRAGAAARLQRALVLRS